MADFTVRTPGQLPELLKAYRRQSGMSQTDVAVRLGVTQQTLSALERSAAKVSAGRLMQLLAILGVELVLRDVVPPVQQSVPLLGPKW